jgi:hypothetical protein
MTPRSLWSGLINQVRGLAHTIAGELSSERGGSLGMRVRGPCGSGWENVFKSRNSLIFIDIFCIRVQESDGT